MEDDPNNKLDPNDIIRHNFDTEDAEDVKAEIHRLYNRKRIGLKASYTRCYNALTRVMSATMYGRRSPEEEGDFDTTRSTREQLESYYHKLTLAYEKLSLLHERVLEINLDVKNTPMYQAEAEKINNDFKDIDVNYSGLRRALSSQQPTQETQAETTNTTVKPMTALEPEILSFENNPIEMNSWLISYRAYSRASKFHKLPNEEQFAFIKKRMHIEVWQYILQKMGPDTPVFHEDEQHNTSAFLDMSVFDLICEAFEVKYPIITRRLEFFNSKRQGNQSFTDWFSKLKEMQFSAAISEMRPDEILIMRICTGIEDQAVLDRILQIPNEDFKLEEVQRLCVRAESAKNFQKQMKPQSQQSYYTGKTNYQKAKQQEWTEKYAPKQETNNDTNDEKQKHFDRLKKEKLCFRCGELFQNSNHKQGCPKRNSTCQNCGKPGHTQAVCATPKTKKHNTRHTTSYTMTKEDEQTTDSDSE